MCNPKEMNMFKSKCNFLLVKSVETSLHSWELSTVIKKLVEKNMIHHLYSTQTHMYVHDGAGNLASAGIFHLAYKSDYT